MKTILFILTLPIGLSSAPLLDSWYTKDSGKYARIWATIEDETAEKSGEAITSLTTWDRADYPANFVGHATGDQTFPVYAGVQEILFDEDYVYVRSTGLPTHTAGPWYGNIYVRDDLFPSFPGNQSILYRFPQTTSYGPDYKSTNEASNPGNCGLFVNGVPLYNTTDTFGYSNAAGSDGGPSSSAGRGDGYWNRDAFVNEGPTFDAGNSHQSRERHHYHASPTALRHLLGDSVDYDPSVVYTGLVSKGGTSPYTENFNGHHSPIIGWVNDGLPMYGPYGFSDPTDSDSDVRLMVSGYQKRDGSRGSYDIPANGRNLLPQWVVSLGIRESTDVPTNVTGPDVSDNFVLGHYMEDYAFKGDLIGFDLYNGTAIDGEYIEGTHFDLNEYNARYCVTPEFPEGTWAYFTAIQPNGDPTYPYNLAPAYFGNPTLAGSVGSVPANATLHFAGGASKADGAVDISADPTTGEVTIVWDSVEGGVYRVETTTDFSTWDTSASSFTSVSDQFPSTDVSSLPEGSTTLFYRLNRLSLNPYENASGVPVSEGNVTHTFTFSGNLPPDASLITDVTIGSVTGYVVSYSLSGTTATVDVTFDATNLTAGQSYRVTLEVSGPPPQMQTMNFTSTNEYTPDGD